MLTIRTTGLQDYMSEGQTFIKTLIMGAPSAGKTRSASFYPRPIFADCEKGRMSIADRGVPYGEILSTKDMDKLLEILALECKKPYADRRYQTLVIDTIDAYQRIVIAERLDAEKKEALSGWSDWGYLDGKMTQFIAKLHALPMNIVVNVHVKDSTEGEGDSKSVTTGVKLKGDFKDQIAAEFDLVGYMGTYWEAEGGERVLKRGIQWTSEPTKPTLKDRSGQLPRWTPVTFTEEDYTNLYASLIGHLDNLKESEVIEQHETDTAITAPPQAPRAGGPVVRPAETPRKAVAQASTAGPAAPKALPTPVSSSVPAAPKPVASVPAATKPTIQAAPTPDAGADAAPEPVEAVLAVPEAVATEPSIEAPVVAGDTQPTEVSPDIPLEAAEVAAALGGEVIEASDADAGAADAPATAEPSEAEQVQDGGAAPSGTAVDPVYCGTGFDGAEPTVEGCGVEIVTDANGGQHPAMLVEIAQLKTRSNLCPACFAAYRAASKKVSA